MPSHFGSDASFWPPQVKTSAYVQVTGAGDLTKLNIPKGDTGGEVSQSTKESAVESAHTFSWFRLFSLGSSILTAQMGMVIPSEVLSSRVRLEASISKSMSGQTLCVCCLDAASKQYWYRS